MNSITKLTVVKTSKPPSPKELKDLKPLKELVIFKSYIESFIYKYTNSLPLDRRYLGPSTEFKAFKCIINKYDDPDTILTEDDKQLVICIIDLNRSGRFYNIIKNEDIIIDQLIDELDIKIYLKPVTNYFDMGGLF